MAILIIEICVVRIMLKEIEGSQLEQFLKLAANHQPDENGGWQLQECHFAGSDVEKDTFCDTRQNHLDHSIVDYIQDSELNHEYNGDIQSVKGWKPSEILLTCPMNAIVPSWGHSPRSTQDKL